MKRLEAAGLTGSIDVAAGEGDLGVIEFHAEASTDKDWRANLVVTMSDGKVTSMQDYRRRSKTRRAAGVSASH